MSENSKPYTKSLADELDWKLLDQLHNAVSQISGFCFEIKKFCVTTTFIVLTLLVKFTSNKLDDAIFVAGFIIPFCFWFLDSIGYYYQVKLRGTMEAIRTNIKERAEINIITNERVISKERIEKKLLSKVKNSFFNNSMWLYVFMITIDIIVWGLYKAGNIL